MLGLGEEAGIKEIREAYRKLALKYHPDRHRGKDKRHFQEMSQKINHARDVIVDYCANYRFSFRERDVKRNAMDKETYEHLKRFYDGWFGDLGI